MRFLIKNSLKDFLKRKTEAIISILLFVLIFTAVISLYSVSQTLQKEFTEYSHYGNIEDASFGVMPNVSAQQIETIYKEYKVSYDDIISLSVEDIFDKYDVDLRNIMQTRVQALSDQYHFDYVEQDVKLFEEKKDQIIYYYKAVTYNETVNKDFFVQGEKPKLDNELAVSETFYRSNNLSIGDVYQVKGEDYKVTGSFIRPTELIVINNKNSIKPTPKTDTLLMFSGEQFEKINHNANRIFSIKYQENFDQSFIEYAMNDSGIVAFTEKEFNTSIETLRIDIQLLSTLAVVATLTFLVVAMLLVRNIIEKNIKENKMQIGLLKAEGYKETQIARTYLLFFTTIVFLGLILGVFAGTFVGNMLIKIYTGTYQIREISVSIDYVKLMILFFLIEVVMCVFVGLSIYNKIKISCINLLNEVDDNNESKLIIAYQEKFGSVKFTKKLKHLNTIRSTGKVVITMFSFLLISYLCLSSIALVSVTDKLIEKEHARGYEYEVHLEKRENNIKIEQLNDIYGDNQYFNEVKVRFMEQEIPFQILESTPPIIPLKHYEENLYPKLDGGVVISESLSKFAGLEEGQLLNLPDQKMTLLIVGVNNNELGGFKIYASSTFMGSEDFYKGNNDISGFYANDEKDYETMENVFSSIDKTSAVSSIEFLSESMKLIAYIIGIMSIILIACLILFVGNSIIDDNKKTLSMFKIMGYGNKEINKFTFDIFLLPVILGLCGGGVLFYVSSGALEHLMVSVIKRSFPLEIKIPMIVLINVIIFGIYLSIMVLNKKKVQKVDYKEILVS